MLTSVRTVKFIETYLLISFFLDEAQVMKNAQTKIAQSLRRFVVPSVFALSGTPIENHLGRTLVDFSDCLTRPLTC